jgi:hypothetical protein
VLTDTEAVLGAVGDVEAIRTALEKAHAAAVPTTGILPAGVDEVSEAVTALFSDYGKAVHLLSAQAQAFHQEFAALLKGSSEAYQGTESFNTVQTAEQTVALILGGTGVPTQPPANVANIMQSYIDPRYPNSTGIAVTTPQQFKPLIGSLSWNQSVSQGATDLNQAILSEVGTGNNVVVWATSQSSTVASMEIRNLMAQGAPYTKELSFILTGNPNNPNGGILARFPGLNIPKIDLSSSPATPPNSPYQTVIFTNQYDGISDFPEYPLHFISDANALAGFLFGEHNYSYLTPSQVSGAIQLPTSPGYQGNTVYYEDLTQDIPLLNPVRWLFPHYGNAVADLLTPDLRVLVDLGYGDGYANIPTPARLVQIPNAPVIAHDLAIGTIQGVDAFGVDMGWLPQSDYPSVYPFVPELNPGLNFT